ncbi:endo-1,4-beta-xylanase [Mariniblastus fucicola]|uniref:endo-1,4-beta-xylanase n=1 Tax=Mariniblastus fucicola TaxID=980251 RepID=UPI0009462C3C|nr:endo-1,4-beta-xylanase [Mariniblastus fucicola]
MNSFDKLESRSMLAAGIGLQAQFYDSTTLSNPVYSTVEEHVSVNWGFGSPNSSIPDDGFAVRWSGQVESRFTETHDLIVNADDGVRLWVNGELLIDQLESGSLADERASIELIAGRRYDIQLEYVDVAGEAFVDLEWESPSQSREIIPQGQLFPSQRGQISFDRWNGIAGSDVSDLTSLAEFPNSPNLTSFIGDFEETDSSLTDYGRRIYGYVHPSETGPYTFFVSADESAELWLSNTNSESEKLLIASVDSATGIREWDASPTQRSAVVYLNAGQEYFIEALHKESGGDDHLSVGWIKPGSDTIEVIDAGDLSPQVAEVAIFSDTPNVAEGSASPAKFTITRSGPTANSLRVYLQTFGDAVEGSDFESPGDSIDIPAGQSSVTLEINAISDSETEGSESLNVELQAGPEYTVGFKSQRIAYGNLQDDVSAPAGGTSLWNGQTLGDFTSFGGTFTSETDATFGNVIQADIAGQLANAWNAQLKQSINGPVNEGDILWVEFYARSLAGPGEISAIFEKTSSPYTKSLSQGIALTDEWERIQIPFYAAESYAAGEASFGFHLGHKSQVLRFAQFSVLNYGPPQLISPENSFYLNNIGGNWGTSQTASVTGQDFSTAFEVTTSTVPDMNWKIQTVDINDAAVIDGDTMRFEFWIRATAGADPAASFAVQRTDTYATLFSDAISPDGSWQFFSHELTVGEDFSPGGLQAVFNVGHSLQTIQIGGFRWSNLSNAVNLEDLPSRFPSASYEGRDGLDPWRDAADQRIEDERKSTVTITVNDINGQPVDGAVVSLRQNQHEFLFGSAINAYGGKLDPNGNATALKYQNEIKRLFNAAVMENSNKWPGYLQDPARARQGVDFAIDNDIYLRGHNLIWPSRQFMPDSVWSEYDARVVDDGETSANAWLTTTIEDHFDTVLTDFDGDIREWDVVNEPWSNHDVMDIVGDNVIVDWYQQVRDFDPDIKLALNDFGIFAGNGSGTEHRDVFEYWLGLLADQNLLDVIGEQSHYSDANLTDITVFADLLDEYHSEFDVPIAITEFDVNSTNEQLQADYLRDYMTMAFSQSSVTEFLHWGFWESSHWLPDAALYRSDFSIKPNGQAYEDLVFGDWWTDVQGSTRNGAMSVDAFRGNYDVLVQYDGETYSATVTVDATGNSSVVIDLPVEALNYAPILSTQNDSLSGNVADEMTNTGTWFEPDHQTLGLTASIGNVTLNDDGTWSWTYTPSQVHTSDTVTITGTDSAGAASETTFAINAVANVRSRGVSYGESSFGEETLASDKVPLLPGETATFANYTSFEHGINRVVVEFAGLESSLNVDDFEFRVGNNDDVASWELLSSTSSIPLPTVSTSPGEIEGVDQILLSWPDNAIENTWLQVVLLANSTTGLSAPDVFYFGNAIGDTGDSDSNARVNANDVSLVRNNLSGFFTVGIENRYDMNRDGRVNASDVSIVRNNLSGFFGLNLITAPINNGGAGLQKLPDNKPALRDDQLPTIDTAFSLLKSRDDDRDKVCFASDFSLKHDFVASDSSLKYDFARQLFDFDGEKRRKKK